MAGKDDLLVTEAPPWSGRRHLLSLAELSRAEVEHILDLAETFFEVSRRPVRKVPTLRGKTIINFFVEASTRTRTSFELAGKRLSADVVNISGSSSSLSKGESLRDTAMTLQSMQPDVLVVRHSAAGAAAFVANAVTCSVVNAGDGAHAHPTQALLDAYTVRRARGTLSGLNVVLCGDIAHSRVARSHIELWPRFGSTVRVVGPRTLMPRGLERMGVRSYTSLPEAFEGADLIVGLRVQRERLLGPLLSSLREYSQRFCITEERLRLAKPDALLLHPGPINRGVELDSSVADGVQSKILEQVEAGVAVRMAVLYLMAGDANASKK